MPDTYSALAIASRSDMPALAPRRLVALAAQSNRVKPDRPAYASPNVEISLVFLRDRLNDPAIVWMRDQIPRRRGQALAPLYTCADGGDHARPRHQAGSVNCSPKMSGSISR